MNDCATRSCCSASPALPAAAAPFLTASPDLCFTAGSVTYRLSANAPRPTTGSRIDNQAPHPDLRVRLVDRVEAADFALTDDAGALRQRLQGRGAGQDRPHRAGRCAGGSRSSRCRARDGDRAPISRSTSIPPASAISTPPPCSRWSGSARTATASSTAQPTTLRRRSAKIRTIALPRRQPCCTAVCAPAARIEPNRNRSAAHNPPHKQRKRGRRAPSRARGKPAAGRRHAGSILATARASSGRRRILLAIVRGACHPARCRSRPRSASSPHAQSRRELRSVHVRDRRGGAVRRRLRRHRPPVLARARGSSRSCARCSSAPRSWPTATGSSRNRKSAPRASWPRKAT